MSWLIISKNTALPFSHFILLKNIRNGILCYSTIFLKIIKNSALICVKLNEQICHTGFYYTGFSFDSDLTDGTTIEFDPTVYKYLISIWLYFYINFHKLSWSHSLLGFLLFIIHSILCFLSKHGNELKILSFNMLFSYRNNINYLLLLFCNVLHTLILCSISIELWSSSNLEFWFGWIFWQKFGVNSSKWTFNLI